MDAWNWPHVARLAHLRVTASPSVGDVAVWPHLGGRFGHVAFVTDVFSGGRFSVAEYNLPSWLGARLDFDVRSNVSPVGVQFIVVPASRG
jgi:surface antigen